MNWTIKWLDTNGIETQLTNSANYKVIWGSVKGMSGPPFNPITQGIPLKAGSHLKNIDVDDNEIDMTVMVTGTSEIDLWNQLTNLINSFNPLMGDGVLKVTPPHGNERWLTCRCVSGFRLNEPTMTATSVQANLVFSANDHPFWQSSTVFQQTASITGNPPQWFPIFPLRMGDNAVVSEFTVNNTGNVETYPIFIVNGPGQNPKVTNLTTGEFIGINPLYILQLEYPTDSITIDTENRIFQDNTGVAFIDALDFGSSFFSIQPGINTIRIEMANATTDSSINMSYRLQYLGVV